MDINEKIELLSKRGNLVIAQDKGQISVSLSECSVIDTALMREFNKACKDPSNWEPDRRLRGARHLKGEVNERFAGREVPLAATGATFEQALDGLMGMVSKKDFVLSTTIHSDGGPWGDADIITHEHWKLRPSQNDWQRVKTNPRHEP